MDVVHNISWFGHASFQFTDTNGNRIYYVDPFELPNKPLEKADLLFITHAHSDHLSPDDIAPLLQPDTTIIAPIDCLEKLHLPEDQQYPILPNEEHTVKGFHFLTVPAYNISPEKLSFHPQANNWVGYVFTLNGKKIYHAGDTDIIPEMEILSRLHLDIAMLPIGGIYTMDVEEAARAANMIAAKITIPMHYRRLLGENYKATEEQFKTLVTNSQVLILPQVS